MKSNHSFLLASVLALMFLSACNSEEQAIVSTSGKPFRVKTISTPCDWKFEYCDNFNFSNVNNDYGLNDFLPQRQVYGPWKNTTWTRKGGAWYYHIVQPWFSQVNHPNTAHELSFHLELSAVMLNKLISAGTQSRYRVSFITNPVKGEQSSGTWTSFMLDSNNSNSGYVTSTNFGFLIGSNGSVSVFQNGHSKTISGYVSPAAQYDVILDIRPGSLTATINGIQLVATLDEVLPTSAYAFLGAYIEPGSGVVSWFDNLVINTQYSTAIKRIINYGYYFTFSSAYGDHLSEVTDYTNFNHVLGAPLASLPNTKTIIVDARWQFWGDESGNLRTDWQIQWNLLKDEINANIDKVKGIYLCDEPFWGVNVQLADYNAVLNKIKTDCPNIPIIAVFAYPTVNNMNDTRITSINGNLDWVGADEYVPVSNFSEIINLNNILTNKRPNNNIFLIPQTFFQGTLTDQEVAEINWKYYDLALSNPKVVGIWNFGLWSFQQPSEVNITLEVQRLIGHAITTY